MTGLCLVGLALTSLPLTGLRLACLALAGLGSLPLGGLGFQDRACCKEEDQDGKKREIVSFFGLSPRNISSIYNFIKLSL